MNIILHEWRLSRKSLFIWSVSLVILVILVFSEFKAYYNNPEMTAILDSIPKALLEAFGMAGGNLTTVSGYVSVMTLYFKIMLGIFAILYGSNSIAKEERDRTAEFLMTMPVSRERVIACKLVVGVLQCFALVIVMGVAVFIASRPYAPDTTFYQLLFLILVALFIVQLIFLSVGFSLASVMKHFKLSSGISVSVIIFTYFLSVIMALHDSLDFLKYITPFKFFEANILLKEMSFSPVYLIISSIIILLALSCGFLVYPKRDLRI